MNVQTTIEQSVPERLARVRAVMAREGVDALLVPSADPHLSEYLPGYWQGRRWLSGFDGSVGTLVVTADFAGVWVDSRYWEQAEKELAGSGIVLMKLLPGKPGALEWLGDNVRLKGTVAVDGAVMALASARQLEERLKAREAHLATDRDLLAEVWEGRPALPANPIYQHLPPYATVSRPRSFANCGQRCRRGALIGTSSRRWTTSPGCSTCAAVMCPTTRSSCPLHWLARARRSCSSAPESLMSTCAMYLRSTASRCAITARLRRRWLNWPRIADCWSTRLA